MKKIYIILFLLPLMAFTVHKYYLSLCEIEYVEDKQAIQIILNVFIDDLEVSLNKDFNTSLNLATTNEAKNVDVYYEDYLQKHLKITVNNQLKKTTFIGKKYDDDVVRFYLEIPNIKELKSLEVFNTILLRDFNDQQNIVKIKVNTFNKTFYFDKKTYKGLLNF